MTNSADDELRILFLEEAGDRLGRIQELLPEFGSDPKTGVLIRRDLHALKGASKMMGYPELAQSCHEAEDLVAPGRSAPPESILNCFLRLASLVEDIAGEPEEPPLRDAEPEAKKRRKRRPANGEMRIPATVVDDLADRGARLGVVAVAAEGIADRVFRLATLAERGVGERAPQQVLATLATSLRQVALELETGQRIFRRLADNQFEALLRLQVQPLRPFLKTLGRHAGELAEELGKKVHVKVTAGAAQLDRRIVEALREALLHLVRNAVDHGIEGEGERRQSGKSETAEIRLQASTEGDRVRLLIEDDGRGIDPHAVVATALERGLVTADSANDLDEVGALNFLFRPGFTTREEASTMSGRGMGLDAVAAAVRAVGGDVWLTSSVTKGTTVTVEVPLARRGERVLALKIGQHQIALPAASVRAFRKVGPESVDQVDGRKVVRFGDSVIAPLFLSDLLDEPGEPGGVLVETIVGGAVVGVVADAVLDEEEVIIHPVPGVAGLPPGVEGITLLSSGRPVAVLSTASLASGDGIDAFAAQTGVPRARPIRVLLVDDSNVTREMVRRLLEDGGFTVLGVGNADDALRALDEADIDCMVTDIEMPGMDGLALTSRLREDPRFTDLPIIVVSTLDRPSDRLAGLESGADAYLTKQGLDARGLIALVQRLGGEN